MEGVISWQGNKLMLLIVSPTLSFGTRGFVSWNINFCLWSRENLKLLSNLEMTQIEKFKNSLADGMAQWVKARAAKPE